VRPLFSPRVGSGIPPHYVGNVGNVRAFVVAQWSLIRRNRGWVLTNPNPSAPVPRLTRSEDHPPARYKVKTVVAPTPFRPSQSSHNLQRRTRERRERGAPPIRTAHTTTSDLEFEWGFLDARARRVDTRMLSC